MKSRNIYRTILKIILVLSIATTMLILYCLYDRQISAIWFEPKTTTLESGEIAYDLDATFGFSDSGLQSDIDKGLVTKLNGDFFHHDTPKFKKVFYSFKPGDKVIMGGEVFEYNHTEKAHAEYYDKTTGQIITESGVEILGNETTELVICADDKYWDRSVAHFGKTQ